MITAVKTAAEFARVIAGYSLTFSPLRDPSVEHARLPSMVGLYWHLADSMEAPPTQLTFSEAVADAASYLSPRSAVLARAQRAYPALVRQHHFEFVLRDRFRYVYRSRELDMSGFDFLILDDGRAYGVGLSVNTQAATDWQIVKRARHATAPIPVLELYADPEAHRAGRFWLHSAGDIEQIEAFIEREKTRLINDAGLAVDQVYRTSERRPRCSRADYASGFVGALAYLKSVLRGAAS